MDAYLGGYDNAQRGDTVSRVDLVDWLDEQHKKKGGVQSN